MESHNHVHVGAFSPTHWRRGMAPSSGVVLETNHTGNFEPGLDAEREEGRERGGEEGNEMVQLALYVHILI